MIKLIGDENGITAYNELFEPISVIPKFRLELTNLWKSTDVDRLEICWKRNIKAGRMSVNQKWVIETNTKIEVHKLTWKARLTLIWRLLLGR